MGTNEETHDEPLASQQSEDLSTQDAVDPSLASQNGVDSAVAEQESADSSLSAQNDADLSLANSGLPSNVNTNEEMGAELTYGAAPITHTERDEDRFNGAIERSDADSSSRTLGWVSLAFAIASWFIWPVLLGAAAVVMGVMAFRQGARGLGGWAITIGIIAIAINLIIVPLFYALT